MGFVLQFVSLITSPSGKRFFNLIKKNYSKKNPQKIKGEKTPLSSRVVLRLESVIHYSPIPNGNFWE